MLTYTEARAAVVDAVTPLPAGEAARLLAGVAYDLRAGHVAPAPPSYGPNETLPCGTESARRRHLAHGRDCALCGIPDTPPRSAGADRTNHTEGATA